MIAETLRSVRYAARSLAAAPAFTTLAVLTRWSFGLAAASLVVVSLAAAYGPAARAARVDPLVTLRME